MYKLLTGCMSIDFWFCTFLAKVYSYHFTLFSNFNSLEMLIFVFCFRRFWMKLSKYLCCHNMLWYCASSCICEEGIKYKVVGHLSHEVDGCIKLLLDHLAKYIYDSYSILYISRDRAMLNTITPLQVGKFLWQNFDNGCHSGSSILACKPWSYAWKKPGEALNGYSW